MAKKLIAIEVDGTDAEAEDLANAIWTLVHNHPSTGEHYVYLQGFAAKGWPSFEGEIRVSERATKARKAR